MVAIDEHSPLAAQDSGLKRVNFNLGLNRNHYTYASYVYDRTPIGEERTLSPAFDPMNFLGF